MMGKCVVVGIGPGKYSGMTVEADEAIKASDVIVGYKKYIELVMPLYADKEFFDNGMRQETVRCREALRLAQEGKNVAVVCSGDSCVYGMAGLIYELSPEYENVEISVIPGVTAALSGSAVLGAALGHDFAVISLSDLLTPRELIERRLDAAAYADFSICIYNPSSHGRPEHFRWACDVLLRHKSPDTPAGWVRNAGRSDTSSRVMTLGTIRDEPLDMFCTAIIGNSQTVILNKNLMVTPRGYKI